MSSPLNRQNNMPSMQSTNTPSIQSSSSSTKTNATNKTRAWPTGGSSRQQYQRRGGSRLATTGASTTDGEQQASYRRGGQRGRGSWRGRPVGQVNRPHNIDLNQPESTKTTSVEQNDALTHDMNQSDLCQDSASQTSQHQQSEVKSNETFVRANLSRQSLEYTNVNCTSTGPSNGGLATDRLKSKINKPSRTIGGKYKQRREASQLLEGLDGFDIDLLESLTPSSADVGVKSRHQTNTRKINLSHLVNHSYDRQQRSGTRLRNDSTSSVHNEGVQHHSSHHHYRYHSFTDNKFSKQQFLQANCQFVVLDGYDCTIHKVNPDWPVDWSSIEEVKFRQTGATETICPICLEPPIAAKITKCGHIYCWACMLRYLSMSDENKVPCPICFEPIYVNDLRSVVSQSYPNHKVGEMITMKLMFRRKGCVEVGPHSALGSSTSDNSIDSTQVKERNETHYSSQANLIIVDPLTVVSEVAKREKDELQSMMEIEKSEGLDESGYSGMVCFIEQAIEMINKRIDKLEQMDRDENRAVQLYHRKLKASQQNTDLDSTSRSYFFYQSADGQHIYLNPFSTKILCHEYGSLENCPLEIRAEVLQMDWISMNETWRKRFKYLEHLPLSCEFRLIEINFDKLNLVSSETYKQYELQIDSRAKDRTRRLREEAKRDKMIQVEQNRKIYGIQPSLEISLDNPEQFPSVLKEHYFGLDRNRNLNGKDDDRIHEEDPYADQADQVTLSFAEIQLQEAAKMERTLRQQKRQNQTTSNAWVGPSNRPNEPVNHNLAQSSFAQLLVDAKTSQQKWTKSTASSSSTGVACGMRSPGLQTEFDRPARPTAAQIAKQTADRFDDGGEELRAPPCEFTISDYLNLNVVSGNRRGRKKKG